MKNPTDFDADCFDINTQFRIVQNTYTLRYEIQYREVSCFAWLFGWCDSFKEFTNLDQAKLCVQEIEQDLSDRRLAQNAKRKVVE